MTCIAAIANSAANKVWMGGDRCLSRGSVREYLESPKIWPANWKGEEILFGCAGNQAECQTLRYLAPLPNDDFDPQEDFVQYMVKNWIPTVRKVFSEEKAGKVKDGSLCSQIMALVGRKGYLYTIDDGFGFTPLSTTRMAVGSGGEFAHGVLRGLEAADSPLDSADQIRKAIEEASNFCSGVGGHIDILST